MSRTTLLATCAVLALFACSKPQQSSETTSAPAPTTETPAQATPTEATAPAAPPSTADIPAGAYKLDKNHATLLFRVNHLGFSHYTASFKTFDADLQLDPANPSAASVTASVDPASLTINYFPEGFEDELRGPNWLDAAKYPEMKFVSTKVDVTGPNTANVTGDFTLHGVTHPETLAVTFNGGYKGFPQMDPNARIGFSAHGTLKRSDYGIAAGIPQPGTTMGVSDEVEVIIESEFIGPPLAEAPAQQ